MLLINWPKHLLYCKLFITCRTRRPFSASIDSQQPKKSSINSWPTLSNISLQNATFDPLYQWEMLLLDANLLSPIQYSTLTKI